MSARRLEWPSLILDELQQIQPECVAYSDERVQVDVLSVAPPLDGVLVRVVEQTHDRPCTDAVVFDDAVDETIVVADFPTFQIVVLACHSGNWF